MNNKKPILLGIILGVILALGPIIKDDAAAGEQPKKTAQPPKTSPSSRWDTVLQAAKSEGTLIVYTTANPATRVALTKAFKDRYGLTVEFLAGRGEELAQRIATENRAGVYLGDALLMGAPVLRLILKPAGLLAPLDSALMLPEVTDPTRWRGRKLPFIDKEHQIIAFVNKTGSYVAVNTDSVKAADLKSFRDFLDPKWKGKIVMDDPTVSGAAEGWAVLMLSIFGQDKGKEYLQQITKQDPVVLRDKRAVVEWLARNKYSIAIGADSQTYSEFKANGAPVAYLKLSEASVSTSSGGLTAMLKRAAHPNMALVFVNWLLTKEGQTIFQKAFGAPSARLDIDMAGLETAFIPQEGERLIQDASDEWYANYPVYREIIRQIFKPLM